MVISSAITGSITLIFTLGGTLLFPICTPCVALPLGTISGFLTSFFEKPQEKSRALTRGAFSGAISGVGAFLGQSIGAAINGLVVGPTEAAIIMEGFLGFPETIFNTYSWNTQYWISLIGSTVCISLFNILLMAGMGAIGGLLWWTFTGNKS